MTRIVTFSGGLSNPSTTSKLTDRIAGEAARILRDSRGTVESVEVEEVSLRALASELLDMSLTGIPSAALEAAFDTIRRADALVVGTPVYNAAPVGLFTLFWQMFPDRGLAGIPVLLAGTGGTARHSLVLDAQVRPLQSYLKALVAPTTVYAATDDWGAPEAVSGLAGRIAAAAAELADLVPGEGSDVSAFSSRGGREIVDELDPEAVVPFDVLLG